MIRNLRELGGLLGADGRKIKKDLLFRSAMLNELDEADINWLHGKKINLIVDLRTAPEARRNPDPVIEGIENINHYLQDEHNMEGLNFKDVREKMKQASSEYERLALVPSMGTAYSEMIVIDSIRKRFCELIRLLTDYISSGKGSVLFHCTSGKDRTGMTAAMLCSILGVSRKQIYDDYYISLEHAQWEGRQMRPMFKERWKSDALADKMAGAFTVDHSFLDAFFDEIDKRSGSLDAFIRDEIGLNKKDIKLFRDSALEG